MLEEKLVKRKVSLKVLGYGNVEEASKGTVRQTVSLNVGISDEKAREIGKYIKGLTLKGVQHQVQGDQLRVSGKKRDDLQKVIGELREHDFGIPLQFVELPGLTSEVSAGRTVDHGRTTAGGGLPEISVRAAGGSARGGGRCAPRWAGASGTCWRTRSCGR